MSNFKPFNEAMQEQFAKMSTSKLFITDVTKDALWETYLKSFPEGTNPMFRERTEYDCQCCKQFIRACGNVVTINNNKLVSIWDIKVEGHFQVVADALAKLVKSKAVKDVFLHGERKVGTKQSIQILEKGDLLTWDHFFSDLPKSCSHQKADISSKLSDLRSNKEVLLRSLQEIDLDAVETVSELIEQGSLYRGEEHKGIVDMFVELKNDFDRVKTKKAKDNYCWIISGNLRGASKIRNTVIGTLLVDLSEGVELDKAVRSFETKVAPMNYKRPTALVTKAMITKAQEKVASLGIEAALQRRYATIDDITINNILFADRNIKKNLNVFDKMINETPTKIKNLDKVEEVGIEKFILDILPKAEKIEVQLENSHINNLMSLIAPQDKTAKSIFKWGNNFSWNYNGEVTDSIKERVKKAGGNVEGVLRCSLSWFNYDDLDIHVIEPGGNHIYFANKRNRETSGILDVDMNISSGGSREAVENITWGDKDLMEEGIYALHINQFTQRERADVGFDVEVEYGGNIHSFHYELQVKGDVTVATFKFSKAKGIEFISSLPKTTASKEVWGVNTNNFHPVTMIMNSPNHWDGEKTGNKHYFFVMENCKNDKAARGFFNEFLKEDLREHRKVFEVLGSKMKVAKSDDQLSGLGFSSTQRNHLFCKITGKFSRVIKILI